MNPKKEGKDHSIYANRDYSLITPIRQRYLLMKIEDTKLVPLFFKLNLLNKYLIIADILLWQEKWYLHIKYNAVSHIINLLIL